MYFGQLIVVGLLTGAVLSLVGVGFTLVLGVGRIANFAHGALVGLGMYLGYATSTFLGLNPYVALVPSIILFGLLGWGISELFEWRGRKIGDIGELLVGLSLLLLINGLLAFTFGTDARTISNVDLGSVEIFGYLAPVTQLIAAGFTLVVALAIFFFVRSTRWGRALRAVSQNASAAGLQGIRVPIAQRAAVIVSIMLAGVAGMIISPFSVMTPAIGGAFLINAFAIVIIGGIGNTLGAVGAGLGLGVVSALATGYLDSAWASLAPLVIVLVMLLVRPLKVTV
jgi:branched-chain amino acid transport system permease protein